MKNVFLISLLLFLFIACKKEKIIEEKIVYINKENSWNLHNSFQNEDKPANNSYATNEFLFVTCDETFAIVDSNHRIINWQTKWDKSFLKQPIGKEFHAEVNKEFNYVNLKPNLKDIGNRPFSFNSTSLPKIDSTFNRLALSFIDPTSEVAVISNENQILIPIITDEYPYSMAEFYHVGVNVKSVSPSDPMKYIDTTFVKKLSINNTEAYNRGEVHYMKSFFGKFFVSIGPSTYLIRSDGTYNKILDGSARIYFQYENSLYAVVGFNDVYKSDDKGESWKLEFNQKFFEGGYRVVGFNIGSDAFFYQGDKIFQILISPHGITKKELVNDGLEGNKITSVSLFKNRVYVTTLSGVFYRSYKEFLTYKESK